MWERTIISSHGRRDVTERANRRTTRGRMLLLWRWERDSTTSSGGKQLPGSRSTADGHRAESSCNQPSQEAESSKAIPDEVLDADLGK